MCSVVGYIGKNLSKSFILEGLSRLEYRGYDSAGFACLSPEDCHLVYLKSQGLLKNLIDQSNKSAFDGYSGIGHTRWATHGPATMHNAHPQFDCDKTISVVHNGIIENHLELKEELTRAGHIFSSDTDTEVIAHGLEELLATTNTVKDAALALVKKLEGAYAFAAIMQEFPDHIIAVRKRSPLCIGIGDGEMFVASDQLAFAGKTKKVVFLPDQTIALVQKTGFELYSFDGKALVPEVQELTVDWTDTEKQGHEHFMLKEIYEQRTAIYGTIKYYKTLSASLYKQMGVTSEQLKSLKSLCLIGCGTSWHAARIAQFFFEQVCRIPTRAVLASEFRYMPFFHETDSLYIAISQSGETADTLEALRLVGQSTEATVALTNVPSSTLVREAGGFVLTQAGPEIAVASTKAFSTQVALLYYLAHRIAHEKGLISARKVSGAENDVLVAAEILESCVEQYKKEIIQHLAPRYAQYKKSIFLGRHISYPFAMEAALKLKEISYMFAQCYPAGELKHGPIALIDEETPIFMFSVLDPLIYQKLVTNAQEVKARNGHLVVFAFEGQHELIALANYAFVLPRVAPLLAPLAMTGLMQFFVYAIAKHLGRPIDKPRNLAKSVTVE